MKRTLSLPLILGVLAQTSSVEALLNNLAEADFDLHSVSVILSDVSLRNKIAEDAGPLKGASPGDLLARLVQCGLIAKDAQLFVGAVKKGQALVAMSPPPASVDGALEMFNDYKPVLLKVFSSQ